MSIVSALIDSREPQWAKLLKFGGASVSVTTLDAGDLWLACSDGALLAVERKTDTDFLHTLKDDRLFPQVTRLRAVTPWAYLVISGDLRPGPNGKCLTEGRETGWNWASIQGALLDVQELGVHVLFITSDYDYETAVTRLANRDRGAKPIAPPRDPLLVGEAETILATFPGVGPERVKALLDHCGTAAYALDWLTDGDYKAAVPGIGEGTKRRVRRALGLTEGNVLAVVSMSTEESSELTLTGNKHE